jgi:hypothetical protein
VLLPLLPVALTEAVAAPAASPAACLALLQLLLLLLLLPAAIATTTAPAGYTSSSVPAQYSTLRAYSPVERTAADAGNTSTCWVLGCIAWSAGCLESSVQQLLHLSIVSFI